MITTITRPNGDFTNRDFDSWILELRSKSTSAFPGWTDYNTPNVGNILLEMFAHTLDQLSFYQDQQYRETRVAFARLRRSMILLGQNVGFRLPGAEAATVDLEITIADGNPRGSDIVLPAGTVVRPLDLTEDVEFDILNDVTIPAGTIQVTTVAAENARVRIQEFVAPGTAGFTVLLDQIPFLDGSASATVGVDSYTEVENFLSSGPTDKHFVVTVNENDRATLTFGDGVNGEIPSGNGEVVYKTGGGADGLVDANTLQVFRDGGRFPANDGEDVQLLVRNPSASGGGVDRMSVEEARVAIPASIRTSGQRSVTREDFEDNARRVRGVARVMMLTSNEDPVIPENEGRLYLVPVGGGVASTALKTAVEDLINNDYPPTLTFTFSVEDPTLKIIALGSTVFLNSGVTETEAREAVESSVDEFFSLLNENGSVNTRIDFGLKLREQVPGSLAGEIPFSDLFNVVRDAALPDGRLAFRKIESFSPSADVSLADTEFPVPGAISLTNGDTLASF